MEFSYQFFWGVLVVVASAGVSWGVMRQSVLGLSESVKDLRMRLDAVVNAVGDISSRRTLEWSDLHPRGKPLYTTVDRCERTSHNVCAKIQEIKQMLAAGEEKRDEARKENAEQSLSCWREFDTRLRSLETTASRLEDRANNVRRGD